MRARYAIATAGVVALAGSFLVAPASRAAAPGSPQCNATGGAITSTAGENLGGNFVHTFTGNGTFTPKQTMNIDYLVVGGGGGGGGATTSRAGGGGGAGEFITASGVSVTANTAYTITVGGGGAGGATSTSRGTAGTASSIGTLGITAAGGGGGAAGTTNTTGLAVTNGESAGGGAGAAGGSTVTGGSATAPGGAGGNGRTNNQEQRRAGGGGGGDTGSGVTSPNNGVGGNGGTGTTGTITGLRYAAGGGGGGRSTAGTGTSGVSGNGGLAAAGVAAPANRGGGGGGAGNTSTLATTLAGGAGGSGIVIIRYTKNAGCPGAPTSPAFSSPNFTWVAPSPLPVGQTISFYTVVYRVLGSGSGWGIYARNGTATTLHIIGKTLAACTLANSAPWTCVLGNGDLQSGTTYEFKVFARTSTSGLSKMSTAVTHTPI